MGVTTAGEVGLVGAARLLVVGLLARLLAAAAAVGFLGR